jgi:hypothetical protein
MAESTVTPLQLTAGVGFYSGNAITANTNLANNITSYNSLAPIANLLYTINAAASNAGGISISSGTLANLKAIGANVSGNYCPALGDSVSSNVSITVGNAGFTGYITSQASTYLGSGDFGVFAQAFGAAQGYISLTNNVILSAVNVNSTDYLGPTFTNMNNLITNGVSQVNLAFPALGADLAACGDLINFRNIDLFGTPAALLNQLARQGNMLNGSTPCVTAALQAQGLTDQDIANLVNINVEGLFRPNGITQNVFDTLQKRAYPALVNVTGSCLQEVLDILNCTVPNIATMADLLNPVKIFPTSFSSFTLPTANGPVLIYDTTGAVNSAIAPILNSGAITPVGCDQLAKILPPDTAAANRALQIAFQQIKGIQNILAADLAEILNPAAITVAASTITQTAEQTAILSRTLGTLKGLALIANTATPVPATVPTYYASNIALGSGPNGTFLVTDFFGSAAGVPYNTDLPTVTSAISAQLTAGTLTTLNDIYSRMKDVVIGTYGTPPTISIPAGPGTGTYATYNLALAALITAADAAVGTAVTAMGTATTTLNTAWTEMVQHSANEIAFQTKASIDYTTITTGAQLPITAFIPALAGYGQETQTGMAAQFLESIANTANQYGQALVGALREGRNTAGLNSINLRTDNGVPQQPTTVPPQATLSDDEYTPAEARALV